MKSSDIKLHYYQKTLIKKLTLTKTGKRFNDLIIRGMESEHMNYHLKKLLEIGFVKRDNDIYLLTDLGKDYSNLLDDGLSITEKQPKTSIIIRGTRKNLKGEVEQLFNRRLRHPYYGKVGRITGKVLFGETLRQAAERELYEETGLKAKNYILEKIYKKMRKNEQGIFIQDVIFYIFFVTDFTGDLIKKTPMQENFWMTEKELRNPKKYDLYDDFEFDFHDSPKELNYVESIDRASGF